jgi:hypothetical protein
MVKVEIKARKETPDNKAKEQYKTKYTKQSACIHWRNSLIQGSWIVSTLINPSHAVFYKITFGVWLT